MEKMVFKAMLVGGIFIQTKFDSSYNINIKDGLAEFL